MIYNQRTFKSLLFILLIWAYPGALLAVTPAVPTQPHQYVVDLAGVLDTDTRSQLNARLKDLEAQATVQMVVLTINSLDGEPIEQFSHQTAVKWGIGQKGKDNGILLTVAVKDHKYRIEVGYGLESTLPDSLVGGIGREYLVPNFRKGDFGAGIVAATTEIINKISNKDSKSTSSETEQTTATTATATPSQPETPNQLGLILTIVAVIILLPAIALIVPRIIWAKKRGKGFGFWSSSSGGSSSWGSSDSGFSGGGGDFGGGGASGDW